MHKFCRSSNDLNQNFTKRNLRWKKGYIGRWWFPSYSTWREIDICPLEKRERERVSRRQEQMVRELVNTEARVKVWGGGARDGLKRACWVTVVVTPGWSDPPLRVMSMNYTHKSVPMCVTCPAGRIAKRPVMSIRPIRLRPVNGNPKVPVLCIGNAPRAFCISPRDLHPKRYFRRWTLPIWRSCKIL